MGGYEGFRLSLLGSTAALALACGPVLAGEDAALRERLDALRARLDRLEQKPAAVGPNAAAAPADAVTGGDIPGSFKLPGSDTSFAIHGYAKLDVIHDFDANLGDTFAPTSLPGSHTANRHADGAMVIHARQSRLHFETRTPTGYGPLATVVEVDFFGAEGNPRSEDASVMRVRHAYGSLGPLLAGQSFPNWMDLEDQPERLEFHDMYGTVNGRQGQIRLTEPLGKFTVSASLENSAPAITTASAAATSAGSGPAGAFTTSSSGTATNAANAIARAPDATARIQYTDSWGHLSLSGALRRLESDNGGGGGTGLTRFSSSAMAGGVLAGGSLKLSEFGLGGPFALDRIGFNGYWGVGIDRYLHTGPGTFFDAFVLNFATPGETMKVIEQYGGFAWAQHFWSESLRSTLAYSISEVAWPGAVPVNTAATQFNRLQTVQANLIWSPIKAVNIGLEFSYALKDFRPLPAGAVLPGGTSGDAKRLMGSLQYLF